MGDCFVQPLSEMGDRRMDPLQSVSVESAEVAYPGEPEFAGARACSS